MKLLTHNMLTSKIIKGVKTGYPLKIEAEAENVKVSQVDFNSTFIARMIPKLEWDALYQAAESLGQLGNLSTEVVTDYDSNTDFLKAAHHALMEIEIIEGNLVCPETGRKFPISNGIPNMLLTEEET